MLLSELTRGLVYTPVGNLQEMDITNLVYDSRKVTPGSMFICLQGHKTDGHQYGREAVEKGAVVLLVERKLDLKCPQILVENSRQALALLAVNYYGDPAKRLLLAGVTGTNGKTTIVHMLKSIAEKKYKSALIGTVGAKINGQEYIPLSNTSPESLDLQAMLAHMYRQGVRFVATEVSSHGLHKHRLDFCRFDLAIFSNLTRDHLDYHKTMSDYYHSKANLFARLKKDHAYSIINIDDRYGQRLYRSLNRSSTLSYSMLEEADCRGRILEQSVQGMTMAVSFRGQMVSINLPVCFLYNAYNALAAAAGAFALGFSVDDIVSGFETLPQVPGRMERVDFSQDFQIYIDYAHTPDGLEQALSGLNSIRTGRIILVFGCVGDGDRGKRPLMAKIAEKYADLVVVTSDQPKFEKPEAIIKDITAGFTSNRYLVSPDRTRAVCMALDQAREGDLVLLAGLGHEKYQQYREKFIPYSDYDTVANYFSRLSAQKAPALP